MTLEEQLIEAKTFFGKNIGDLHFAQAGIVIGRLLDHRWWESECTFNRNEREQRTDLGLFLTDIRLRQYYIVALADALYSLQSMNGWKQYRDRCIRTSKNVPPRKFDEVYCELVVARLMQQIGATVQLRPESGTKGNDFDLFATIAGVKIAMESKLRIAGKSTDYLRTFKNTLDGARKQLPRDAPGAIVVYVPSEWLLSVESEASRNNTLQQFFNTTGRINFVALWYEDTKSVGNDVEFVRRIAIAENASARVPFPPEFGLSVSKSLIPNGLRYSTETTG